MQSFIHGSGVVHGKGIVTQDICEMDPAKGAAGNTGAREARPCTGRRCGEASRQNANSRAQSLLLNCPLHGLRMSATDMNSGGTRPWASTANLQTPSGPPKLLTIRGERGL